MGGKPVGGIGIGKGKLLAVARRHFANRNFFIRRFIPAGRRKI
jgi:ribose 1,5-bisphosphokinase PhnN